MVDVSTTPAVPPEDPGGDGAGYHIAGGLLLFVGFGWGVGANLLAHIEAGSGSIVLGPWVITSTFGPYAWAVLLLGLFTGLMGIVMLLLARTAPKGPVILPGTPY